MPIKSCSESRIAAGQVTVVIPVEQPLVYKRDVVFTVTVSTGDRRGCVCHCVPFLPRGVPGSVPRRGVRGLHVGGCV